MAVWFIVFGVQLGLRQIQANSINEIYVEEGMLAYKVSRLPQKNVYYKAQCLKRSILLQKKYSSMTISWTLETEVYPTHAAYLDSLAVHTV